MSTSDQNSAADATSGNPSPRHAKKHGREDKPEESRSWLERLTGVLNKWQLLITAAAALIVAIATLIADIHVIPFYHPRPSPSPSPVITSSTPPTSTPSPTPTLTPSPTPTLMPSPSPVPSKTPSPTFTALPGIAAAQDPNAIAGTGVAAYGCQAWIDKDGSHLAGMLNSTFSQNCEATFYQRTKGAYTMTISGGAGRLSPLMAADTISVCVRDLLDILDQTNCAPS